MLYIGVYRLNTMASELIQFRLSGAALEELQAKQQEGESLNLAAQRLMRDLLGIVDKPVDIDERIDAKLENAIAPLQNQIEELKGTNVYNSIQVVIESLTSRMEQLEQRLQEETREPIFEGREPGGEGLKEIRDRVLKRLKLGKQASGYKAAVKALNMMIDELSHDD